MNGSLLLEILDPLLALADRNARALALLHVSVRPTDPTLAGQVVTALEDAVREADLVARLSPDRFAVALVEVWGPGDAVRVAHRIARTVESLGDGMAVRIGVAFYPSDARDSAGLLADSVRATTSEPIAFADPAAGREALARAGLLQELNGQRTASQFRLHYQPIQAVRDGSVVGAEALVRWDRGGSLLPASDFIGLARSTGRIRTIELWTMRRAFPEARRWRQEGWDGWMSINVSGRSLADPRLPELVAELMETHEMPPESVLFEVTERSALAGDSASIGALEALRSLGARIAVDDFGAGYASFEYLCDFDPDIVKLDRAFTARRRRPGGADLLDVLVDVAHRLEKPVVVEGVENRHEWDRVAATQSEFVQGYFTGRPVPGPTFIRRHLPRRRPGGDPTPAIPAA